jgi:hypothetical protein
VLGASGGRVQSGAGVSGSLVGTLTDPGDATVPGAPVTLTNQEAGAVLKAQSDKARIFRFANLPRGVYTLVVGA